MKKENKEKEIFEQIMTKKISKLLKDNKPQIQDPQRTPNKFLKIIVHK